MFSVSKLLCIAIGIAVAVSKDNSCYRVIFLNKSSHDHPPEYLYRMHTTADDKFHSVTTVNREIAMPIMRMKLTHRDGNSGEVVIFNITAKLCDFLQVVNQVQIVRDIAKNSLRGSNYSFTCPLCKGVYVVDNLRLTNRNPLIAFIYKPMRIMTFEGGMSEELPNKTVVQLSQYTLVLRIAKKPCQREE